MPHPVHNDNIHEVQIVPPQSPLVCLLFLTAAAWLNVIHCFSLHPPWCFCCCSNFFLFYFFFYLFCVSYSCIQWIRISFFTFLYLLFIALCGYPPNDRFQKFVKVKLQFLLNCQIKPFHCLSLYRSNVIFILLKIMMVI